MPMEVILSGAPAGAERRQCDRGVGDARALRIDHAAGDRRGLREDGRTGEENQDERGQEGSSRGHPQHSKGRGGDRYTEDFLNSS